MVSAEDFEVCRFIGRGCYSIVYEVRKKNGSDSGSRYALKRFFLENDSSVKCVLRERRILERLSWETDQSPFLPMLFYAIWHNHSSAFVLREGAGCDLYDLLCHVGYLSEADARFYLSEVICGLEHLHSLSIVHLDIKPENVLFYHNGHVFLSDLDRSFDLTLGVKPTLDDFTGTPIFMAPEVAKGEHIDLRSDIWSIGALTAEMVSGPIRADGQTTAQDFQRARTGSYNIRGLKKFTKALQSFFTVCLQKNYNQRPYLTEIKKSRFLKFVDWGKVLTQAVTPPFKTSDIKHRPAKEEGGPIKSTDKRVLDGAFSPARPVTFTSKRPQKDQPNQVNNSASAVNPSLDEKFVSFRFVHPSLVCVEQPEAEERAEKIQQKSEHNFDDMEALFADMKLPEVKPPPPSPFFTRPRTRGVSIGD